MGTARVEGAPPGFVASIVGTFLLAQGLGLLAPVLPELARHWDLTDSGAALLLSSLAFGRLVFSFPGGALADRYGLRAVAVGGSATVVACTVVSATTEVYAILLVAQLIAGMATAAYTTAAMASIVRHSDGAVVGRMLARFQGAIVLGLSVSPLVGGIAVDLLGVTGPFWYYCGSAAIGLVLSVVALPPPARVHDDGRQGARRATRVRDVLRLAVDRRLLFANLAGLATLWSVGGVRNTLVPLFAESEFAMRPAIIGAVLGAAAVMNVVALVPGSRIADHAGRRPALRIGMVWLVATTALLVVVAGPWTLLVVVALGGVAKGLVSVAPLAVVSDVVDEHERGTAVGVARTTAELGLALGPVTVGVMSDLAGPRAAFLGATSLLLGLAIAVFRMPETLPTRPVSVRSALRGARAGIRGTAVNVEGT